ncbi:MAG: hypothetical protein ABI651_05845 [Verrucomicrobiota bacterium]
MKTPRQFLPVLKQMMGFYRFGPLPLLGWLSLSTTVLVVSSIFLLMQHQTQPDFMGALFVWCCMTWLFLMLVATPVPFQMLGGLVSLEFLFTRALDRGLWLRTERTAVMIIALGPLILNLLLSPLSSKLAFDRADAGSPAAALQERYLKTFPGSQIVAGDSSGRSEQLVIRHGTEMFAAWLVWSGTALVFLMAGYWSLVFTRWQRAGWHHSKSKWRPWLVVAMIHSPFYVPVAVLVGCAALQINPCEESFLIFARHPVIMVLALIALILIVQPWSERNIRKLEFEFF